MNILGISCHYHDSAACLIRDGKVVVAVQEERFNRRKNSAEFPLHSINYCVQAGEIAFDDIDYIGFYEKPYLKFSRVILNHLQSWPLSLRNFLDTMPFWLQDRLTLPLTIENEIGFKGKVFFIPHHLAHAASSFLVSPFHEAAIITADSVGEWATMTYGYGQGNDIQIVKEIQYPHSLGLLYSAVTTFLGFKANEEEGTVMALAGFGEPRFLDIFKNIVRVHEDGSFFLDESFFGFNAGLRMYSKKFIKIFGKERKRNERLEDRHCDIAASLQKFIEETLIIIARNVHREFKFNKLCLAGGVFLNCVANSKILEETPFKEIYIQPAAGDSGGSLGVAAYINHVLLKSPRDYVMDHAYVGTSYSDEYLRRILLNNKIKFKEFDEMELCKYIAREISKNMIIGWFQGKMEFGPRALGNRSILANPCNSNIKELLNEKIKKRESFRPYAPAVLEERAGEFFKLTGTSPFMLLAPQVRNESRERILGVVHIDGTARVQTVNKNINNKFWRLIKEFESITGIPILINTSFNLRGEPIVCSPEDALDAFKKSQMDCLVLNNFVVNKLDNFSAKI